MSDLLYWGIVALFLAVLLWAFWPPISRVLRITANEGDELMAKLPSTKQVKRAAKKLVK